MAQRTDTQALPAARPQRKWSPRARRDTINGILFALPWMIGLALFWMVDPLFRDRSRSTPLDDLEPAPRVEERAPVGVMRSAEQ